MLPISVAVAALLLTDAARAADVAGADASTRSAIDSGEFRNTAQTTPKGVFLFHPFLRSQYGITDRIDIKAPILGSLAQGPRVFVEFGLIDTGVFALSVEPGGFVAWNPKSYNAGGSVRSTVTAGALRFNLSVGASYGQSYTKDIDPNTAGDQTLLAKGASVPVNVGVDLDASATTTLRLVVNTLVPIGDGSGAVVGVNVNHAFNDQFRLSAGVAFATLGSLQLPSLLADYVPDWPVLPGPTLELWWRF